MKRTKATKAAAKRTREGAGPAGATEVVTDVVDIGGGFTMDVVEKAPMVKTPSKPIKRKKLSKQVKDLADTVEWGIGKKLPKPLEGRPKIVSVVFGTPEHTAKLEDGTEFKIRGNLVTVGRYGIEANGEMYIDARSKADKGAFTLANQAWMVAEAEREAERNRQFTNPQEFAADAKDRDLAKARRAREARKASRPVPAHKRDKPSTAKEGKASKPRSTGPARARNGGNGGEGADAWGYRSWRKAVNAVITDKGKSKEEINKESGISMERLNKYLPRLVAQELVVEKAGKYSRK